MTLTAHILLILGVIAGVAAILFIGLFLAMVYVVMTDQES